MRASAPQRGMATVMITTGGTGGHIFPGLAVASELIARGARVFWLGTRDGMEARLVPKHGVAFEASASAACAARDCGRLLLGPFALSTACRQAVTIIARKQPSVVLGFGGFASFPGALMGVARGLPLVMHDSTRVAGLANRVLAHGADRVLPASPACSARHAKARRVGRQSGARATSRRCRRPSERFAGRSGPLRLLVVGGSLGAHGAERTRARGARAHAARGAAARRAPGRREAYRRAARGATREAGVEAECVAFIDDMARALR